MTSSGLPWSEDELKIVHDKFPVSTWAELEPMLPGRTRWAVKHQAWKMGLQKTLETRIRCEFFNHGRNGWTKDETQTLIRLWTTAPMAEVAAGFPNRSAKSLQQKAQKLGLKRPPAEVKKARLESSKVGVIAHKANAAKRAEKKVKTEACQKQTFSTIERAITPRKNSAIALASVMSIPLEAAWRGAL